MNNKIKNIVVTIVFATFMLSVAVLCVAVPKQTHSKSERRDLAQFPQATKEEIFDGDFSRGMLLALVFPALLIVGVIKTAGTGKQKSR